MRSNFLIERQAVFQNVQVPNKNTDLLHKRRTYSFNKRNVRTGNRRELSKFWNWKREWKLASGRLAEGGSSLSVEEEARTTRGWKKKRELEEEEEEEEELLLLLLRHFLHLLNLVLCRIRCTLRHNSICNFSFSQKLLQKLGISFSPYLFCKISFSWRSASL